MNMIHRKPLGSESLSGEELLPMEQSIPEALRISPQLSLWSTDSATSLPGLADGALRSDWQVGRTSARSGPVAAHAHLSARLAREKGLTTSGTYGPRGTGSSVSADLNRSLANRFHQRLKPGLGSILFKMTWKQLTTPSGRLIFRLAVSARRKSGTDSILEQGWPSVTTQDNVQTAGQYGRKGDTTLAGAATLAGWGIPAQQASGVFTRWRSLDEEEDEFKLQKKKEKAERDKQTGKTIQKSPAAESVTARGEWLARRVLHAFANGKLHSSDAQDLLDINEQQFVSLERELSRRKVVEP